MKTRKEIRSIINKRMMNALYISNHYLKLAAEAKSESEANTKYKNSYAASEIFIELTSLLKEIED